MHHPKTRLTLVSTFFFKMTYPRKATSSAQVDSTNYESLLLGENTWGTVHLHGPFGDAGSEIRIAYLIGMHPLESKAHRALFEELTSRDDLKCAYYIYNINVTDKSCDSEGRTEGQILARDFVKDDIIDNGYDLFIDIHSNRGRYGMGNYEITDFIFPPADDEKSSEYADKIISEVDELTHYVPSFQSSPQYITVPAAEAGIPTLIFECYSLDEFDHTLRLSRKLVSVVDRLF